MSAKLSQLPDSTADGAYVYVVKDGASGKVLGGSANGFTVNGADGKIASGQLPTEIWNYQSKWNASTNTPALADGAGTAGDAYLVDVAGSQDLGSGSIAFNVGDAVVYNGTVWEQIPHGGQFFVQIGGQSATDTLALGTTNAHSLQLRTNNFPRITIDSIGNVGIGVDSPSAPLAIAGAFTVVAGGVGTEWNPTSGNDLTLGNTTNHPINVITNGTTRLTVAAGGQLTASAAATNDAPSLRLASTDPQFEMSLTNAAADAKRWNWWANGTTMTFRALNDAGNAASNAWTLTRAAGAVTLQQWGVGGANRVALSATNFETTVPNTVVTGADGSKVWLAKYTSGTGHNNAPGAIGATSAYLQIGGREYGNGGYGGIGFSYVSAIADHPAVWIGWQERNTSGSTNGDFLIATRSVTTNTAPTERLRITNLGSWGLGGLSNTGTEGQVITSHGPGSPPTWEMPHLGAPVTHTAATVTLTATDVQVHLIDASSNAVAVTLPDATGSTAAGKPFTLKKIDNSANVITINAGAAQIDLATEQVLNSIGQRITVVFDGTNYQIIG